MSKKVLFVGFLMLCVMAFAGERRDFNLQQLKERKEFKAELKDIPTVDRKEAREKFNKEQYTERRAEIEKRVSDNAKLTTEQKEAMLKKMDENHAADKAFMESVKNDTSLTKEQKREKIKAYMQERRAAKKAKRAEQTVATENVKN